MKYYIDTEFIERPNTIDLISIGIKCEDGRTFYAESSCFDEMKASPWVIDNVITKLRWHGNSFSSKEHGNCSHFKENGVVHTEIFGTNKNIKTAVIDFIKDGNERPEFWGYYADYDWVVFCWLFGSMIDLPDGWPMYCLDLKQLQVSQGFGSLPDPEGEHNALVDACWNEDLHNYYLSKM